MPHGGYHGTVKIGGKTVQQGYKDNSGNYQIRGGIDDNSRLDKNPPRNVQPAQLPNIPDNLITNKMRLQNIVDNKDIFKNQPSPTRPGMNVYQDRMQDFRTSTPEAMQTYADRFPLTQMAMTGLPRIAMSMIPGGNVFSAIANAYQSGKGKVQGGARSLGSNLAGEFSGTLSGLKGLLPTSVGGQNVPGEPKEFVAKKFVNESNPDIFELNTSIDTPESELLFKIPGMPGYMVQKNPDLGPTSAFTDVNKFVDLPNRFGTFVKFNEGGLASLNNQDYNKLMNASNFGF